MFMVCIMPGGLKIVRKQENKWLGIGKGQRAILRVATAVCDLSSAASSTVKMVSPI
jgi:hypothetical protein